VLLVGIPADHVRGREVVGGQATNNSI
jgi:hypothetical protein